MPPGDLVVAVGHESVGSLELEELQQKVAAARKNGRKNVILRVEREGNTRFIDSPSKLDEAGWVEPPPRPTG